MAQVIAFPQYASPHRRASASFRPFKIAGKPETGLHLIHRASRAFTSSQEHAHRIVAQIEREIALQAVRRARKQNTSTALPPAGQIETPATVARRIFHMLRSFARSA